jgi:hypothetical protein
MAELFALPADILAVVLGDWVDIDALGKLDTASCSYNIRSQLVDTFSRLVHKSMSSAKPGHCINGRLEWFTINHLEWVIKRKIKIREWRIECNVVPSLVEKLVYAIGGVHVWSVTLAGWSNSALEVIFRDLLRVENRLSELVINDCEDPAEDSICNEANLPSLRTLRVYGSACSWDWGTVFAGRFLQFAPSLRDVRLYGLEVNEDGLEVLLSLAENLLVLVLMECGYECCMSVDEIAADCKNLKLLVLGGNSTDINVASVTEFAVNCTQLESLHITGSMNGEYNNPLDLGIYHMATNRGAALKHLSLANCDFGDNLGLRAVAKHCPSIEELQFCHCSAVDGGCLAEVVSSWQRLRELVLNKCDAVTDAVLKAIAEHAANLTSLCLCATTGYTAEGAAALVHSDKALRRFGIENNHSVFTAALLEEWRARAPCLEVVNEPFDVQFLTDIHS